MSKAQCINFDDLKARADFRAVLLHYGLTIVGQDDQAKVPCPLHDDARPSFSVNLQKGLWHCFAGCGAGNVHDFVHRKLRHLPSYAPDHNPSEHLDDNLRQKLRQQRQPGSEEEPVERTRSVPQAIQRSPERIQGYFGPEPVLLWRQAKLPR